MMTQSKKSQNSRAQWGGRGKVIILQRIQADLYKYRQRMNTNNHKQNDVNSSHTLGNESPRDKEDSKEGSTAPREVVSIVQSHHSSQRSTSQKVKKKYNGARGNHT